MTKLLRIAIPASITVFVFSINTPAYAQSSVTLYGLIDAGLNYLSNAQVGRAGGAPIGHSQYSFQDGVSGGQNGSRWGLLGTEDLGGGTSAVFASRAASPSIQAL